MSLTVYFHADAENEMNEAADFLDQQCPGLEIAFLTEVDRAVDRIRSLPEAGQLLVTFRFIAGLTTRSYLVIIGKKWMLGRVAKIWQNSLENRFGIRAQE